MHHIGGQYVAFEEQLELARRADEKGESDPMWKELGQGLAVCVAALALLGAILWSYAQFVAPRLY